ncbi:protein zntD-like [Saccostrea echinata]|uniref:protein zntD-like n=1 Tax=Saccostrea echinata TaxID=191078 RepID=UPI002A834255|nr:protein zntD-like [Saccostrea echinata]
MVSLTGNKVAAFFTIFFITFLFGLIPPIVVRCLKGRFIRWRIQNVISHLNCFAGGVFFGTAMLHLLAESEEDMREALDGRNGTTIHYPVHEVTVSCGFFIILILEVVLLRIMRGVGHGPGENNDCSQKTRDGYKPLPESSKTIPDAETVEDHLSASGVHDDVREAILVAPSPLRACLFVLALSLHMIFEGLAVGLQETELTIWSLVLAISLHKCVVSFSVGMEMHQILGTGCKIVAFLLVFSILSSAGVLIGMAVTQDGPNQALTIGILQSIATGTFFYVTFFEILHREFSHCHSITKLLVCLSGYAVVAGLKTLEQD